METATEIKVEGMVLRLQDVKYFLLRHQQGVFEPDWYLEAWFNPAVCRYFLDNAVEVVPTSIRWGIGEPFQCHRNALTYAGTHPGVTPFFGFQWSNWRGNLSWELHSFALEEDGTGHGTIINSGTEASENVRDMAVPWSWELYDLFAKQEARQSDQKGRTLCLLNFASAR